MSTSREGVYLANTMGIYYGPKTMVYVVDLHDSNNLEKVKEEFVTRFNKKLNIYSVYNKSDAHIREMLDFFQEKGDVTVDCKEQKLMKCPMSGKRKRIEDQTRKKYPCTLREYKEKNKLT